MNLQSPTGEMQNVSVTNGTANLNASGPVTQRVNYKNKINFEEPPTCRASV